MSNIQYRIGTVSVTNGSQIIIGASTDWLNEISAGHVFKADRNDNRSESTYSIGNVVSASRAILAANYTGSTDSSLSYVICRDYTTNRGYWRPGQGDYDLAELMSQEIVDQIDTDIQYLYDNIGTASIGAVTNFNASVIDSKAYKVNPQIKTSDYQMASRDHVILASGNVTITLASASDKLKWMVVDITLATPNASVNVLPSGANTFLSGESNIKLASKGDVVGGFGDGRTYQVIDRLKRGVEISW